MTFVKQTMRLIRKYSQQAPAHAGRFFALSCLLIVLLLLGACQLATVNTTSDTEISSEQTSSVASETTLATTATTMVPSETTTALTSIETSIETTAAATAAPTPTTVPVTPAATTTRKPTTAPTAKPTAAQTTKPTAAQTTKPTAEQTAVPTSTPTPVPAPAASFPYHNYGTFSRNEYGTGAVITTSADGGILLDTGCAPQGVALVNVAESSIPLSKSCKVVVAANDKSYQYEIMSRGKYLGLPLQMGNGDYTIKVYGQVEGNSYYEAMSFAFSVTLTSSLKPFTASSLMSDFSSSSACVVKASSLCSGIDTATGKVEAVYNWITSNISYDSVLAGQITGGQVTTYLPDPDTTFNTHKGICFDYASLMCAMLRSQGIPTRLAIGSTPLGYHAWNEVYFAGTGWVIVASFSWQNIDGSGWVMFDTTFAAGGMSPSDIQGTTHTKQKTY